MTARFKSNVGSREEKAFNSIDMNRVMMAGTATGFTYALSRLLQFGFLTIPLVVIAFFFFIWLFGKRGGIARYMLFFYSWQGRLMIAGRRNPDSLAGQITRLAGWDLSDVIINGDAIYTASVGMSFDDNMAGIEILDTDALDAGGFEIVTDDELFLTIELVPSSNHNQQS